VGSDDLVVDLGAGSGRLTAELARVARSVIAIELDAHLAERLQGRWRNVEVVCGDACVARLPAEPFSVVANLPFDRTTDLLRRLLDDPGSPLVRADLVVDWRVAWKRGVPWPSTLNGVAWGAFYELSAARRLSRDVFEPPPSVDAGVLVCRRRPVPLVEVERAPAYRAFVAEGFRRGPRAVVPNRVLNRVCRRPSAARDLDPHQWAELFRALEPSGRRD
jgi:23S rRNA (adenine-N6)-dimethyltransferase